jgi:hypothetical protein
MRILCEPGETPESISDRVSSAVHHLSSDGSSYRSTRSTGTQLARYVFDFKLDDVPVLNHPYRRFIFNVILEILLICKISARCQFSTVCYWLMITGKSALQRLWAKLSFCRIQVAGSVVVNRSFGTLKIAVVMEAPRRSRTEHTA